MFLPLEWILNLEASQHSLQHVKVEVQNCAFFVILVLFSQPLCSKSIPKVKTQIPLPKDHAKITFLNPIDCFLSEIAV